MGLPDWGLVPTGDSYKEFVMAPQALKICGCLSADSNSKLFAIGNRAGDYDMDGWRRGHRLDVRGLLCQEGYRPSHLRPTAQSSLLTPAIVTT